MRKRIKRIVASVLAVLLMFTMSDWSGLAITVAKADTTLDIYYYNYNQSITGDDKVPLKGTISVTPTDETGTEVPANTVTMTRESDTSNWYYASVSVPNPGAYRLVFRGSDSGTLTHASNVAQGNGLYYYPNDTLTWLAQVSTRETVMNQAGAQLGSSDEILTIHFYNGDNWGTPLKCYAADTGTGTEVVLTGVNKGQEEPSTVNKDDNWAEMTDEGDGWWSVTVPAIVDKYMFCGTDYDTEHVEPLTHDPDNLYIVKKSGSAADEQAYPSKEAAMAEAVTKATVYMYVENIATWNTEGAIPKLIYRPAGGGAETYLFVEQVEGYPQWFVVQVPVDVARDVHLAKLIDDVWKGGAWVDNALAADTEATIAIAYEDTTGYNSIADLAAAKGIAYNYPGGPTLVHEEGTVYAYIPTGVIADWTAEGRKPALIYKVSGNSAEHWRWLTAVDSALYPGWYTYTVDDYTSVESMRLAAPYDEDEPKWPDDGKCPLDGFREGITHTDWGTDGSGNKVLAINWQDSSGVYDDVETMARQQLQMINGYPFVPYHEVPTYQGVWYYRPDWSGEDVYLNCKSDLLDNWSGNAVSVKAVEVEDHPGWFYADGGKAKLYKAIQTGTDANAVQIFFTKGYPDSAGSAVTGYGKSYIYNAVEGDANQDRHDFDPDADVLYFAQTDNSGYGNAAALAAGTGQSAYPGKDNETLVAYYYNGTEATATTDGETLTTGWDQVYADVFFFEAGTTNKVFFKTNVPCTDDGDGWYYVNTELDPKSTQFEDGVYVQFKSSTDISSPEGETTHQKSAQEITAAYQFLNAYRKYANSQMDLFKDKEDAEESLEWYVRGNGLAENMVRIWFYFPGGWSGYNVLGSTAAGGADPATIVNWEEKSAMVAQEAYITDSGSWYYADLPKSVNYIYFDEDQIFDNGGNISQKYDISDRTFDEIFCVVNDSIIPGGWSSSTAGIVKYYDLENAPESNEISLPITILDYNADNLFFEYDMNYLRNMTMVLGNQNGWYNMGGMGIGTSTSPWPVIYEAGHRPGDVPHYDRNGVEYVTGVLEDTLINGYPAYTQQAVEYIAEVAYRGYTYYAQDLNKKAIQDYNKTGLFDAIYKAITGDTELAGAADGAALLSGKRGTYAASQAKYAGIDVSTYDMTADTELTCMDYAYYVLNNLYNPNSQYNQNYNLYSYLVLKRTCPDVYGFYANYQNSLPTSYNLPQNYQIVYEPNAADGEGRIYNNVNRSTIWTQEEHGNGVEGYGGFFPYNKTYMDQAFGDPGEATYTDTPRSGKNQDTYDKTEEDTYRYYTYTVGTGAEQKEYDVEYIDGNGFVREPWGFETQQRNYNFAMKISGKFRFDYDKDLYFVFTGDDDVVMYINGEKVLDLSGAHRAASYTVYLSDLVDDGITQMNTGAYYDLDFFYMERHTTWSNLRIETNIDVIDVSGQVQKRAYTEDGTAIASGAIIEKNTPITYTFELSASTSDGLKHLAFTDPSLGVSISPERIDLGTYQNAAGETVARNVADLVVQIGDDTYTNLTEEQLKQYLEAGIHAGERILISNIKYVVKGGITGDVTATMNSETDNRALESSAGHTIYTADPAISVSKTATDAAGKNLPNNTVLQAGSVADYTITMKNTGGMPLHDLELTDDDLEVAFSVANDGTATVQLNEYTSPSDLTITVRGTGVSDGIYQVTEADETAAQAELEALIARLAQVVYPTGATLEISGVKYPIVEEFPTDAVGTAQPMTDYQTGGTHGGWNAFANAYKTWVAGGKNGAAPTYTTYVDTLPGNDPAKAAAYAAAYQTYIEELVTNGITNATVPSLEDFTEATERVEDDAKLTLSAISTKKTYYSQAGQTISVQLQNEVPMSIAANQGSWGGNTTATVTTAEPVTFTAGAHNIAIVRDKVSANGFEVGRVVLTNIEDPSITYTFAVDNSMTEGATVTVEHNPTYGDYFSIPNPGDAGILSGDVAVAGEYTITVYYANAEDYDKTAYLVVDNLPADYVLTDAEGAALTPDNAGVPGTVALYTMKETVDGSEVTAATIRVENRYAYPEITYTAEESGSRILNLVTAANAGQESILPDTITVKTYDVQDDVYVLDYGLHVELTKYGTAANNNGLFLNDNVKPMTGDTVTVLGTKHLEEKLTERTYPYVDGAYTGFAIGRYGSIETIGSVLGKTYEGVHATYKLNSFLEGIDRFAYAVQASANGLDPLAEKDATNSTPVMEANITILPATIVYYEDNFASVITNGTVYAQDGSDATEKVWNTTWADGDTHVKDGALMADYGFDPNAAAQGISGWKAWTIGLGKKLTKVNDIYYKMTAYTDENGTEHPGTDFFANIAAGEEYTLQFKLICNKGADNAPRSFAVGAGIDAEEERPDKDLFYTTFRGSATAEYLDVSIPIVKTWDDTADLTGRSLVIYLGPTVLDETAWIGDALHSVYITDVKVVQGRITERQQGNSLDTQYGFDTAYQNDAAYSCNGYTALAGSQSMAFTFTGSGFDLLTRTNNANLYLNVYDADKYELKQYIYTSGGVEKTMLYAAKKNGVTDAAPVKTAYVNAYNENQTIYQIPLISLDLTDNGTYLVVATKTTGDQDLYIDGIRIYDPLGARTTVSGNTEAADAYAHAGGEMAAEVQSIREMILGTGYTFDIGAAKNPVTAGETILAGLAKFDQANGKLYMAQGGTVVESYTGSADSGSILAEDAADKADHTSSLLAYAISGPNNELYLTGEAYVVATVLKNVAADATLQIGMKAVQGTIRVEYLAQDTEHPENTKGVWTALTDAEQITAATEMYYKVDVDRLWTSGGKKVLLLRAVGVGTGDYILSMTNLKSAGIAFARPSIADLGEEVVSEDKAEAGAFEIFSSTFGTRKIILTFSVSDQVKDFAIAAANEEGETIADPLFTWSAAEGVTNGLAAGVKVTNRVAEGCKIYVVSLPVTDPATVTEGYYKLYTVTEGTYAPTLFEIRQ